jgi:hypothetical protein
VLDRLVHVVADAGELGDRVELAQHLGALQPEHGAADHHVLAARQLEVEGRAERQHRRDAAVDPQLAVARQGHAADHLQQSRLAAAVAAQDADALAAPNLKVDVAQHPERLEVRFPPAEHDLLQPVVAPGVELVGLSEVLGVDDDIR